MANGDPYCDLVIMTLLDDEWRTGRKEA